MFMNINFIFVCCLIVSLKSRNSNANSETGVTSNKGDTISTNNSRDTSNSSEYKSSSSNLNTFTSSQSIKNSKISSLSVTAKIMGTQVTSKSQKILDTNSPKYVKSDSTNLKNLKNTNTLGSEDDNPSISTNSDSQNKSKQLQLEKIAENKMTNSDNPEISKKQSSDESFETNIPEPNNSKESKNQDEKISKIPLTSIDMTKADKVYSEDITKNKNQDLDDSSDSSSSHFMIFIFLGLLFTIVAYVAFQKRKKIMAFIIEGRRRTSRDRRSSGGKDVKVSYKPLDTEDKEAGMSTYKYVY